MTVASTHMHRSLTEGYGPVGAWWHSRLICNGEPPAPCPAHVDQVALAPRVDVAATAIRAAAAQLGWARAGEHDYCPRHP